MHWNVQALRSWLKFRLNRLGQSFRVACRAGKRGIDDLQSPAFFRVNGNELLVGGLEHFLFSHILGISSSQLTFIFFRGVAQPPTRLRCCSFRVARQWQLCIVTGSSDMCPFSRRWKGRVVQYMLNISSLPLAHWLAELSMASLVWKIDHIIWVIRKIAHQSVDGWYKLLVGCPFWATAGRGGGRRRASVPGEDAAEAPEAQPQPCWAMFSAKLMWKLAKLGQEFAWIPLWFNLVCMLSCKHTGYHMIPLFSMICVTGNLMTLGWGTCGQSWWWWKHGPEAVLARRGSVTMNWGTMRDWMLHDW